MNKKSKEIVKKLCFTLVVVISIISIIGCPNTVSGKANDNPPPPSEDPVKDTIEAMRIKGNDDPIITDYRGLGFGEKDSDGKFRILTYEPKPPYINEFAGLEFIEFPKDSKRKLWSVRVLNEYISSNMLGPSFSGDNFTSVGKGLEERWKAAKETLKSKGGTDKWLKLYLGSTTDLDEYLSAKLKDKKGMLTNKGLYEFAGSDQYFAVNKNKDIFVYVDHGITSTHFADWHVVFVEKVANPKMYSFHYGPYTLKGNSDEDNPKVPFSYNKHIHVFTLSEMLKDCLKKEGKEAIADQVVAKFPPLLPKNKDKYDVYLVVGKYIRDGGTSFGYGWLSRSFRNVLKLTDYDGCCKDCWTHDESDQDGFPSLLPPPSP